MADYRLFRLDGDGRIALPEQFSAASDDDAVAQARELSGRMRGCELWQGDRLVTTLGSEDLEGEAAP